MRPANYKPPKELFFDTVANASNYGNVVALWRKNLGLGEELLKDICRENFVRFVKRFQKNYKLLTIIVCKFPSFEYSFF